MEDNNKPPEDSKPGFFNKKTLLILAALVVVFVAGTGIYLVKASENPAFCSSCHIMKPYYQSWVNSELQANKHADADVDCHQCHESSIATQAEEGIKFVTGNYETPLEKRIMPNELCLECHDYDEVKAATNFEDSNPHDSHNGMQDCNVCHSIHEKSKPNCAECHSFDWMQKLDASWTTE